MPEDTLLSIEVEKILDEAGGGTPVLTVNRRLSRHLLGLYERRMVEGGRDFWPTPAIMPLESWAERLWRDNWPEKPLLSIPRSSALFRRIVEGDGSFAGRGLLLARSASSAAFEAYTLIKNYRIPTPGDDIYQTEESRAFGRWMRRYEEALKDLGYIDRPCLVERVAAAVERGGLLLPPRVVVAGFDRFTPAVVRLLEALRGSGTEVLTFASPAGGSRPPIAFSGHITVSPYPDMTEEVRQAARWTRSVYRPGMRIGFIVPELARYRALIEREFSAELDPPSAIPWHRETPVFNISLGTTLLDEPLVVSALDILSIDSGPVSIEKMSSVILSPFFSTDGNEWLFLSEIDAALKEKKILEITIAELKRYVEGMAFEGLSRRLGLWTKAIKEDRRSRKRPSYWAKRLSGLLDALNWPSPEIKLTSREFQALEAWNSLVGEFSTLDEILGEISRAEAVEHLKNSAAETLHQPETPDCPVQVLGLLESSGIAFDRIRLLGLHDGALPAPPVPNPFIPIHIQHRHNLPGSSAAVNLAFAEKVMARILASAPIVEASYPQRLDGKDAGPSGLVRTTGQAQPVLFEGSRLRDIIFKRGTLEPIPEEGKIPLTPEETGSLKGGTGIIKDQSVCPFRAFARHRLGASTVELPEPGFDSGERGTLLHEALKNFWAGVKDSKRLWEIAQTGELPVYIKRSVEAAFESGVKRRMPGRYVEMEKDRVAGLVRQWLQVELERDDFTVEEIECTREIEVGGLRIFARFDRVDRCGNGRVVIDYKTGRCSKNDLLPGRPREPQLLLYDLSGGFDALAFASVRIKGVKFVGVAGKEGLLPGVPPIKDDKWRLKMEGVEDWEDLKEKWRETLLALAGEFVEGRADVEPNDLLKVADVPCRYCELTVFCRVYEVIPSEGEEDDT